MPRIDSDKCQACGTCVRLCPMGAIYIGDDQIAHVDLVRCDSPGCEVCFVACINQAIKLDDKNSSCDDG